MRVWPNLSRHYAEPHRHYHTLTHIFRCLRQLDAAKSLIEAPDAVEIAVWFHDVVHDPEACDNENGAWNSLISPRGAISSRIS